MKSLMQKDAKLSSGIFLTIKGTGKQSLIEAI